jgi:hypothetical protein
MSASFDSVYDHVAGTLLRIACTVWLFQGQGRTLLCRFAGHQVVTEQCLTVELCMQLGLVLALKSKMPPALFLAWTAVSGSLRFGGCPRLPGALSPEAPKWEQLLLRAANLSSSCLWCQLILLSLDIRRKLKDGTLGRRWRGLRYRALFSRGLFFFFVDNQSLATSPLQS